MRRINHLRTATGMILISLSLNYNANCQNKIKLEEVPALAKEIKDIVPEGKALFVFETKENYIFDSDNENIIQPLKEGIIYKLFVSISPASGAIIIQREGTGKAFINYGKPIMENSLPVLKNGEVKYFKLSLANGLDWSDATRQMVQKGATDSQMKYEKEALLIIDVFPNNLELKINSDKTITEILKEPGRYRIYVQPEEQIISLGAAGYEPARIAFFEDGLKIKDVKYFRIDAPQSRIETENIDPSIKTGNYSLVSKPSGALIQLVGRPDFNKQLYKTPYLIEGWKAGTEILTLTLSKYESLTDTILISSTKGKKSNYDLIPKFAFINCNIDPAIPFSKIVMDGNEIFGIENGIDYERPKGTHIVEVSAPHFYTETRQMSLGAGKTSELNIKLRPKMGMVNITSNTEGYGSDITLNENYVGTLPLLNHPLQESDYKVTAISKNYVTEKISYDLVVKENEVTNLALEFVETKRIGITTDPDNAQIFIDGQNLGKSKLVLDLGIGSHQLTIAKQNYDTLIENITINHYSTNFAFKLLESTIPLTLKNHPRGEVWIDGYSKGQLSNKILLTKGRYKLMYRTAMKDSRKVFIGYINFPQVNNRMLPVYLPNKSMIAELFNYEYNTFSRNSDISILRLSGAGFSMALLKLKIFNEFDNSNGKVLTSILFTNYEFSVGGALSRYIDISLCAHVDFSTNFAKPDDEDPSKNKPQYANTDQFVGLKIQSRLINQLNLVGFFVKIGHFRNTNSSQDVNSDYTYAEVKKYGCGKFFGVSVGSNIFSDDNTILRLWKKPILANLSY